MPLQLTFKGLLSQTPFTEDMRELLATLEAAYGCPVDVEFTANIQENDQYKLNVVQCRPLQMRANTAVTEKLGEIPAERKLLETAGPVLGRGRVDKVARIIYVVPNAYAALPLREKYAVARLIGRLVHLPAEQNADPLMLLGPGRWGTTTPSLGVTVSFAEIEKVTFLGEIVEMGDKPVPEISLGTHLFSEMVEMDMLYMVLIPEDTRTLINRTLFEGARNRLPELLPDAAGFENVVHVIDVADLDGNADVIIHANTIEQKVVCFIDTPKDVAQTG